MEEKKICFVVQGFKEKTDFPTGRKLNLDASYRVIKEAVEEAGLKCIRADEVQHSGMIDLPMYKHIWEADLVIADLSTHNVNAVFELGVRYGLRPYATIIVAEDQFGNPFDLNHLVIRKYRHLGEDIGVNEARRFKNEIKEAVREILSACQTDSPVYTFLPDLKPPAVILEGNFEGKVNPRAMLMPYESALPSHPEENAKEVLDLAFAAKNRSDWPRAKTLFGAALQIRPCDTSIVQELALATYKSKLPNPIGALEEAKMQLLTLHPKTTNDPETLGLWGAVHKRQWELSQKIEDLDEAITAYERGFYLKQDYYNGINLAFLFNVRAAEVIKKNPLSSDAVADYVLARRVRKQVLGIAEEALKEVQDTEKRYWIIATLWETAVGLEDQETAVKWQKMAEALPCPSWMFDSTLVQLRKLRDLLSKSSLHS